MAEEDSVEELARLFRATRQLMDGTAGPIERSMPRSRTRTGPWSAPRSALPGRIGCGTSKWNGVSGGGGVGYNLPASLGAALANKRHSRFTVAFGGDGDFMVQSGSVMDGCAS